ncbi:hypothetical protein QTG68_001160 [Vibrio vulnificus]|nr:hypothetical protein [Vibrio vulnificus]EME0909789.1 hypothetical protein [Vibrio vulnificus]
MGRLKIEKVSYYGDNYYYESPILKNGINLIVGDNGSGKSTFCFFLDYGLGGNVEFFKKNDKKKRKSVIKREYKEIVNDSNNYVLLDIKIDNKPYKLKRFIQHNEIFIDDGLETFSKKISRRNVDSNFSDWLLEKLGIGVFELTLGRNTWFISFNDLYRLMYYDQETTPSKIFKSPDAENFITESDVVRKSIFETLLGKNSDSYNKAFNEYKVAEVDYNKSASELSVFCSLNNISVDEEYDSRQANIEISQLEDKLDLLKEQRIVEVESNSKFEESIEIINSLKKEILEISEEQNNLLIDIDKIKIERARVLNFKDELNFEIVQLRKILFTHDKLNIFSSETCPFCLNELDEHLPDCKDENKTEKFIYTASDYNKIYTQKSKKLNTIEDAINAIDSEFDFKMKSYESCSDRFYLLQSKLSDIVNNSVYKGSLALLSKLNSEINELSDELYIKERDSKVYVEFNNLKNRKTQLKKEFDNKSGKLRVQESKFNLDKESTVKGFKAIFSNLMNNSALKYSTVSIDENYFPLVDGGIYREKSSAVTVRLMYYYSMLMYSLQNSSVKFPKFLVLDTPEDSGIDREKLIKNLSCLQDAISELDLDTLDFQLILTTGENRYPDTFKDYLVDKFSEERGEFILTKRIGTQ